jgi:hypothetical protein
MPPAGFKPTTSVLERAKTVHVLDRATIVIGPNCIYNRGNKIRALSVTSETSLQGPAQSCQ